MQRCHRCAPWVDESHYGCMYEDAAQVEPVVVAVVAMVTRANRHPQLSRATRRWRG